MNDPDKMVDAPAQPIMNSGTPSTLLPRHIAIAIVVGLTLFSGVVHGVLDGRWSHSVNLTTQGDRLGELPDRVGDWVLVESMPLEPSAARLLRCYGSQVRIYRNETTNALVSVAVLFGPRGPIAVHTPEVCYSSIGTLQVGTTQVQKITTSTTEHELWSAQFARNSEPDPSEEVWYAWSDGGPWKASKYPRVWMTDSLYKIQVAGAVGNDFDQPCREFLEVFLPSLEKVIQS